MIRELWFYGNLFILTGLIAIASNLLVIGTFQFTLGLLLILIWRNFKL